MGFDMGSDMDERRLRDLFNQAEQNLRRRERELRLFLNDETGDENHHLFVVDPVTHPMRDLTPLANISVRLSLWSLEAPGALAVAINDRDARWHDRYRIDLATGHRTLIWENTHELLLIGLDWHISDPGMR
jgi:hypothetical protein